MNKGTDNKEAESRGSDNKKADRPRTLAITGLPGAGKSTIAAMFGELGAPVFDADAVVRQLYGPGGAAVDALLRRWPDVVDEQGGISTGKLRARLLANPAMFDELERIVHPLVAEARAKFLRDAAGQGAPLAVLEIPLLFETGADAEMDIILLADAPQDVRLQRLRQRPGFDERLLHLMQERQLPLDEKRRRADAVIGTTAPLSEVREQVRRLHARLGSGLNK